MPFQIQQPTPKKYKQVTLTGYTEEPGVTEIIVPEEIKALGRECFLGCQQIASVILPDSITEIPYRAFKNCKNLRRIRIPETVVRIGEGAFSGCEALKEITLPENLEAIDSYAFYGPERLMKFRLADGIFRVCMQDIYQKQNDTDLLKEFLCEKNPVKRKHLFAMTGDTKYRSAMAYYLIQCSQADDEIRKYARRNITKTAKFYMEYQETEGLQELFATGFVTKANIEKLLEYAISHKYHESYLLLLEYKNQHIGYQDPAKKLKL